MTKHTIFVNDEWKILKIPDGWKVVKEGVVQLGDKVWSIDTKSFGDLDSFGYPLGHKVDEFFCCIRFTGDFCCKELGEFSGTYKTDEFKFCPFCGKEIKKEV